MKRAIDVSFYETLFDRSAEIYLKTREEAPASLEGAVDAVLAGRDPKTGLTPQAVSTLFQLVRHAPDPALRRKVVEAARALRHEAFGDVVATMVPIEVTSFCASTCKFCGWRADNKEMVRLAITETAIREQARILAAKGFSHFEIAGGDDLKFLQDNLASLVRGLKEETRAVNPEARVSLCLVPMHEKNYRDLREAGLDCVLTWQETYQRSLYENHIPAGPKAWGVDENLRLNKRSEAGVGWMHRMRSQEMAIRAGLQAGLGCMMGLAELTEADMLSVVRHGQELIRHYGDAVEPLILGMPAWNSITTAATDNRAQSHLFDAEANFELIGAIYLLAFGDRRAWVFANGRVHPDVQTATVASSSVFTSTLVQIAPGAYLDFDVDLDKDQMFERVRGVEKSQLDRRVVLSGEQFSHYLDSHEGFVDRFVDKGLTVVSCRSLIERSGLRARLPVAAE
jgi:2-iminoacetate synthase ThiH